MATSKPTALQLCPFSPELESELAARLSCIRWFELDEGAQAAWLAEHATHVRAVVTGGHIGCSNALIAALPNLGLIAINGVGFDKVDLPFAQQHNVAVTTTPDVLTDDVADLAVGLTIALLRGIPASDAFVRAGKWAAGNPPLARKVTGRRFGIVGLGRIGMAIARRLEAFGPIAYTGRREQPVDYAFHPNAQALATASDVLIVACAATPETHNLIDSNVLAALGSDGWLVNVSRGSVLDEGALIAALEAGTIAGAALDVFADEPVVPAALLGTDSTVLTPHIASATVETRRAMAELVLANVDAFLAGATPPSALALA